MLIRIRIVCDCPGATTVSRPSAASVGASTVKNSESFLMMYRSGDA